MSLTFASFRKDIPAHILNRGRDYFKDGHVVDLTFDDEARVWEAQVQGSELYEVTVQETARGELLSDCTCPYDMGEHCKHVAAVLYAIEDAFPDELGVTPRKKAAKRQTRYDKLRQRLEKATREEMMTVLLDIAAADRELLNQLLVHFERGDVKPADFRRIVRDALRAGKGDYGYLDHTGTVRAARKLEELIKQAQPWVESGDVDKAMALYQTVIEETMPQLERADDSSGRLREVIEMAFDAIAECAAQPQGHLRDQAIAFLLERATGPQFGDAEWDIGLLAMALELTDTPARRDVLLAALDQYDALTRNSPYNILHGSFGLETTAIVRLALIDRFGDEAEALEFLRKNKKLDVMRIALIERCLKHGALDEAEREIAEGIASAGGGLRQNLRHTYAALRLGLLRQRGHTAELVKAARSLWLQTCDQAVFALLKESVPAQDWPAMVDSLSDELRHREEQLAWLYATEERWRALMTLVQRSHKGAWLIEPYISELETRYPEEVAAQYERLIDQILDRAMSRVEYRKATQYLKKMNQLGQHERTEAVIARVKQQYPGRRALHDELNKV
jgi:hypothetical protein